MMDPKIVPISLAISRIQPHGLPNRRLEVLCNVSHSGSLPLCLLDAWLQVVTGKGVPVAEGRLFYPLHSLIDAALWDPNQRYQGHLVIPLNSETLARIEEERAGTDLTFRIESRVRLCAVVQQGTEQLLGVPYETRFADGQYTIPQSDWIKILRGLNWSELDLLEIPSAAISASPNLARAYKRLEDGQNFYRRGDWEEAMSNCRKAFEALIKDTAGKDDLSQGLDAFTRLINQKDKAEQINALVKTFTQFLHLARHEQHPAVPITRGDAQLAIQVTASTLGYIASS